MKRKGQNAENMAISPRRTKRPILQRMNLTCYAVSTEPERRM